MSNENTYINEYKKFQRIQNNNNRNRENQSNSNALSESDLRNKIKKNRNLENLVINYQPGEGRNVEIPNPHKQLFESDDIELYKEYVQWDFINNKLYMKGENVLNIDDNERKQEFTNTLKSWFNIINDDFSEVLKYEYYTILPKINVEHPAAQFLRRELIAKQYVTEQDANDKIGEILNFISRNHSQVIPRNIARPLNIEYDRDGNILSVGKFQRLKVPRDKLLSDESEIVSTAKLLLRGESLGNNFRDKESRFVECPQQQQQQPTPRVSKESEWRNPPRRSNKRNNQRNDEIADEWQQQEQQSTPRGNNNESSEWGRRNRENSKKIKYDHNEVRLLSSSSFSGRRHHHVNVPPNEEQQQEQQSTPRGNNNESLEWRRNPPRYNKYSNSNKEEKWKIDYSNKYSERNNQRKDKNIVMIEEQQEQQQFQSQSARVNNESSEWRRNRRNRENNNKNGNEQLRQSSSSLSDEAADKKKKKQQSSRVILSSSSLSSDIDLYKEYVQWDFINNKLYERGESLLNIRTDRGKQEFTNTLQRWFIFINEDFNEVPKYEYFTILPDIQLEHSAAQFLREAIIEKKFANEEDADWKMRKILGFISSGHSEVVPRNIDDPLYVKHDPDRKIVVVNKFQSAEVPRVNLLVKKGGEDGVIATARMLLRYESFGNGSYQWGDPQNVHKVLYEKFNVRYEGFASPVNSRFIEYDKTHFCSLFPETDAVFGSIGNFFHVDMEKHAGGWSVNPPFLNDLMKNVADRIIKILDEGHKCYFFCTFPWWEDDEGWQTLINSRHFLRRFDLLPQHFKVQDAYGNQFEPNMKMNLFVMGELPSTVAKLTELGQELIINRDDIEYHHNNYKNCPW